MLTEDRRSKILELLERNGSVTVTRLSELFDTSESTIRRDLVALEHQNLLKKVHGGATVLSQEFVRAEDDFEVKSAKNIPAKQKIAEYAVSQINDDDFVYLDAGSTTFLMTDYIENCKASFVTNGIRHAKALAAKGCKVFIIGGELKSSTEAIKGIIAAGNLQKYNFSKCFIGTNGISEKYGFSTPDTEEAMLKAVAIDRSFVSYILADSSKFNKISAVTFAQLNQSVIICDRCEDENIKKLYVVKEVL